jgi:hypothetical protein
MGNAHTGEGTGAFGEATEGQLPPRTGNLGVGHPAYIDHVVVVGGGVTGLSAAHELVERGFAVTVIEKAKKTGPLGREEDVTIGGIARTQYVVPKPFDPRAPSLGTIATRRRDWVRWNKEKEIDEDALRALLSSWWEELSGTSIRVMIYSEDQRLTDEVKSTIQRIWNSVPPKDVAVPEPIWIVQPRWIRPPVDRPADSLPILVETTTPIVPGEHGYRFFPSYYRHLRDTLARIPIIDDFGEPTGRTVYDNLEPSPYMAFVSNRHTPTVFPRLPGVGLRDRIQQWIAAESLNGTPRDAAQYVNRLMRYMTLSPQRRVELEDMSWIEYLIGRDPSTGGPLYHYSDTFLKNLAFSGRILAALDNRWADARTCGDVFVQLALSHFYVEDKVDASLNAPTSEAWFHPWKRWLESRGVIFVHATVSGIDTKTGRALAVLDGNPAPPVLPDKYYLLVATDLMSAAKLVGTMVAPPSPPPSPDPSTTSPPPPNPPATRPPPPEPIPCAGEVHDSLTEAMRMQLLRFADTVFDPNTRTCHRRSSEDLKVAGQEPWHRLQTLSGVQFFFDRSFSAINGHVYFIDAPWALSSVNSQIFWRRKPVLSRDGYVSIMSVDVGAWHRRAQIVDISDPKTAAECSAEEIAHTVWAQITESYPGVIKRHRHGSRSDDDGRADAVHGPPRPRWFHIDENLSFKGGKVEENSQPYLLPIKRDWRNRPGVEPWDPTPRVDWPVPAMSAQTVRFTNEDPWWQPTHGGYPVLYDNLVFAGTYLKTFTRMTTMESANESARHAVNAILLHRVSRVSRLQHLLQKKERELNTVIDSLQSNTDAKGLAEKGRDEHLAAARALGEALDVLGPDKIRESLSPVRAHINGPIPDEEQTLSAWWQTFVHLEAALRSSLDGVSSASPQLAADLFAHAHQAWTHASDQQKCASTLTGLVTRKVALENEIATLKASLATATNVDREPSTLPGSRRFSGSSSGGAIRMAARHGDYGAQEIFASTPEGDLCRIWDPEFNETDEFLSLRLLDLALYQANMPPLWDILGLQSLPQLTPDYAQFVEPEHDPRRPADASRASALHAFARSIGLPGIPVPPRNGPEMRVPTDGLGIGAIDSMLSALRANIEPGKLNEALERLRGIRTAFEHALRNPPGAGH